jgi:Calx-beta domain/Bacterial Ig domain/FG-GAP-like repeat/Bacterial cadherin-like domain
VSNLSSDKNLLSSNSNPLQIANSQNSDLERNNLSFRLGNSPASVTNTAPTLLNTNVALTSTDEDAIAPTGDVGTLVSAIVKLGGNVSDRDAGAVTGIAITAFNTGTNGTWFYAKDGEWNQISSVSEDNALRLNADASTRIYFQPTANFSGNITNAITFRAWDATDQGANGTTASTVNNGNITAFSSFADVASLRVNPINDPPINNVPISEPLKITQNVNEDGTLTFSKTTENAISITDVDAGSGSIQVTLNVANGKLSLRSATNTGVNTSGNGTDNLILTGTTLALENALDGLMFKPTANFNGETSITVLSSDRGNTGGVALTDEDKITINVIPVNDTPSFIKGFNQTINEDAELQNVSNWVTKILKGGGDDEANQTLKFIVTNDKNDLFETQPDISPEGVLSYKSKENANGIANITVRLEDNGDNSGGVNASANQTFTIRVNPINDKPINTVPLVEVEQTVNEDDFLVFSSDRGNAISVADIDAGSNSLLVNLSTANGSLQLSQTTGLIVRGNGSGNLSLTGTIININTALDGLAFKPTTNFNGDTSITITTNDQGATGSGGGLLDTDIIAVKVTPVNDAPTFIKGNNLSVSEDTEPETIPWATRISRGASDESSQSLEFVVDTNNPTLFAEEPKIDQDGTLTYKLAKDANGIATVNVNLKDNGGIENGGTDTSTTQSFTITVKPTNDQPTNIVPTELQTINEDNLLVFSNVNGNAIAFDDIDVADKLLQVIVTSANGTLALSNTTNTGLNSFTGANTPKLVLTGSLISLNDALNGLSFKPNTNFNGETTIQIVTNDQGNTGSGGALSKSDIIKIKVESVNDAPLFTKGNNLTINEDAAVQKITAWATKISKGAVDESAQTLEFVVQNDNNALFAEQPSISSDGTLTYKTAANGNGVAKVTVQLQDSGGIERNGNNVSEIQQFTITVNGVNDAPVNNVPTAVQLLDEDTPLEFSSAIGNAITITDIDADTSTVQTTISTQSGTISLLSTEGLTSFEGDKTNSVTLVGAIAQINQALESLTFNPNKDFNGKATINVTTNDKGFTGIGGERIDTDTITVTVNPVNDAPSFKVGDNLEIDEDSVTQTIPWATAISKGAIDEASQTLKFVVSNDNNALFAEQPTIAPNGTLTYKPAKDMSGSATVTVQLQDDGGTDKNGNDISEPQTFTIKVNPDNDAPKNILPTTSFTINEEGLLVFSQATGNVIAIADIDSTDTEIIEVTVSTQNGILNLGNPTAVTVNGDGTESVVFNGKLADINTALDGLTFQAGKDFTGEASITILSKEGSGGLEDSDILKVTVNPVNDAPTVTPGQNLTVNAGAGKQTAPKWAAFNPGAVDEVKQTPLEYTVSSNSNPELFSVAPKIDLEGNLSYTPAGNITVPTTATIGIKVKDSGGIENDGVDTSAEKTFTITINPLEVSITAATEFVNEGNSNTSEYDFTVKLSNPNSEAVTVKYAVVDGTATLADKDFLPGSGTVTFAPGETSKTIKVLIQGDTKFEADQTFKVNLTEATNAALAAKSEAIGSIRNDDLKPTVSIANAIAKEGNTGTTPITFTATLSSASDEEIKVNYAVTDGTATSGSDYEPLKNSELVFAPGQTTQTLKLDIKGDTEVEKNETFFVDLNNPTNTTIATKGGRGIGTIANDDGVNNFDINGDGNNDIIWRNYRSGENAVWLMNGTEFKQGIFTTPEPDTAWRNEGIADFTGDGKLDFLYRNYRTGENAIWEMDGTVRKQVIPTLTVKDAGWKVEGVVDFNGDKKVDIIWRNQNSGENAVWLMNSATFESGFFLTKVDAKGWEMEDFADFDGDKKIDILWRNYQTGENAIWNMDGTKDFKKASFITKVDDLDWKIEGVGDFNNDGKIDIVWNNYRTGENAVWFMNNTTLNVGVYLPRNIDNNWRIEHVADFTGDGNLDLLWRNYKTGENMFWQMNGTTREQVVSTLKVDDTFWQIAP